MKVLEEFTPKCTLLRQQRIQTLASKINLFHKSNAKLKVERVIRKG